MKNLKIKPEEYCCGYRHKYFEKKGGTVCLVLSVISVYLAFFYLIAGFILSAAVLLAALKIRGGNPSLSVHSSIAVSMLALFVTVFIFAVNLLVYS